LKRESGDFFFMFFIGLQAVFNQSQSQGSGRGGGGVAVHPGMREQGGTRGISTSQLEWHSSEGGEEALNVPAGVTYVTEKHFFFIKGTLTYLTLGILGGGAGKGAGEGCYWPVRC